MQIHIYNNNSSLPENKYDNNSDVKSLIKMAFLNIRPSILLHKY